MPPRQPRAKWNKRLLLPNERFVRKPAEAAGFFRDPSDIEGARAPEESRDEHEQNKPVSRR